MPRIKNPNIKDKEPIKIDGFVTWSDEEGLKTAIASAGKAISSVQPIMRDSASIDFAFRDGDSTIRPGFDREDYEFFRPNESIPVHLNAITYACMRMYNKVGIIKNTVDTMSDFTAQGIKIVHPKPGVQAFFQNWFEQVGGPQVSERFSNYFYRAGNAIAQRTTAKLVARVEEDLRRGWARARAANDNSTYDIRPEPSDKAPRRTIPWSYSFFNPAAVKVIGGEIAMFAGKPAYGLSIPTTLSNTIKNPKTDLEKQAVASLPSYVIDAVRKGNKYVTLDQSRLIAAHYKKDDWEPWAMPLTYAVMDDLILLQKMKLADLAALDGAISHIRIWKLGSLDHKIFPTPASVEKLSEILQHAGGGGSMDFIWGPELSIEETKTDIQSFLGIKKYEPVLTNIYAGLGIPRSLTGTGGGFTSDFLSLKTLIERLNYGRDALIKFWNREIKIVQQAMRFAEPAQIEFKHMVLADEAAQHQLLINLLDRDVISLERIREHFGFVPDVEDSTIRREYKKRGSKKVPPKVSPYHDAHPELTLEKIFAQTGAVTPSEVGLELDARTEDEVTPLDLKKQGVDLQKDQHQHNKRINNLKIKNDHNLKLQQQKDGTSLKRLTIKQGNNVDESLPGTPGQGRPKNSKDTGPRKQRRVLPRSSADFLSVEVWATKAQRALAEEVHPVYLKKCKKENMRQLTTAEVEDVEHLKFALLCNMEPFTKINTNTVAQLLRTPLQKYSEVEDYWKGCVATHMEKTGAMPTIDEFHQIQSYVYALAKADLNEK